MPALNASTRAVVLSDGEHTVRSDINRLINIEDHFGGFENIKDSIADVRALLWLTLDPGPASLEATGDLMQGVELKALGTTLIEMVMESLGIDSTAPKAKPGKPAKANIHSVA